MKLVSVVVPIYNTERYLERCIESTRCQTHDNLEIILVDDGSPDNCPKMCDEWAAKDGRIKVIHKQNAGQGMARNTGIEHATGEYICFFDSDDFIAPDTIQLASQLAEIEQAELVLFGSSEVNCVGKVIRSTVPMPEKTVYVGREVRDKLLPSLLGQHPVRGTPLGLDMTAWRVLYSLKLIKKTGWRFVSEREIIAEDFYSLLDLYQYVNRVAILSRPLYFYCYNETSTTHTYKSDRFLRMRHFYCECLKLCTVCGYSEEVKSACAFPFLNGVLSALKKEVTHHKHIGDGITAIRRIILDDTVQKVLREKQDDYFNVNKRIFFWAIRHRCCYGCYVLLKIKIYSEKKKGK